MHRLAEIKGFRPGSSHFDCPTLRLLEALPSLPLVESFVAPMIAPAPVYLCPLGANSVTLESDSHSTEKRKNPAIH